MVASEKATQSNSLVGFFVEAMIAKLELTTPISTVQVEFTRCARPYAVDGAFARLSDTHRSRPRAARTRRRITANRNPLACSSKERLVLRRRLMNAVTDTTAIAERINSRDFEIVRIEANLGAEVRGLDLTAPLTDEVSDLIRSLLWEHQVLFFRDTGIDDDQQAAIGRIFGPPVADSIQKRRGARDEDIIPFNTGPYASGYYGTPWHADATYLETPYLVSILRSVIAPDIGGDTVWSSGVSAYESLPQEIKDRIDGLTAIHRPTGKAYQIIEDEEELAAYLADYPGTEHPVVITHPYNGKKVLYVNEGFAKEIVGLPEDESKELLTYLTRQFYRPENTVRFKWRPGSLAIWDNRATQHYGVADYGNAQRQLIRVVAAGDRPHA
jgi:alpha-ketoglutarate-dependent taurine dioxygenase